MLDYFQILSRAIGDVPNHTAQMRNEVYNRAHLALRTRLEEANPAAAATELKRETQAFREAVAKLETEFATQVKIVAGGQTPLQKLHLTVIGGDVGDANSPDSAVRETIAIPGANASAPAEPPFPAPAAAVTPQLQQTRHKRKIADGDHEFLPAALEILEKPPSPVQMRMLLAICAFVVCGLVWSYFGQLDIVAVAQGKVQPIGRVNIVQPLETGKVKSIRVSNNSRVAEDEVLVEMDASDAQAEAAAQSAAMSSMKGEFVRRHAMSEVIATRKFDSIVPIVWPQDVGAETRLREQRVFNADIAQLRSAIEALRAQRVQKQAEANRIRGTIRAQEEFVKVLQERVNMREVLVARAAGARANVIDALEKLNEQQTQLAIQRGQLNEAAAGLSVLESEIEKHFQFADADNNQKLLQAQRNFDEFEQRHAKALVRVNNAVLRAPSAGTVQAISVINPGQVVAAGEQIMRVVPGGLGLEIEGYILNKDIGFIREGQEAIIKVDSFPFTKFGYIEAKVVRIARDAIPLPEASQTEANPAQSQRATGQGGAQRTQNLVYQITLKPLQDKIGPADNQVQLLAGMTVTLEVKTGKRRIISYLFTPLVEIGTAALKER